MKSSITTKQKEYIIANYSRKGAKHCIDTLKITKGQLVWFCHSNNIRVTKSRRKEATEESINKARNSYRINHPIKVSVDQFYSIQSPQVAYILGLLWADGYIKPPYVVSIECLSDDVDIFQKVFSFSGDWARYNRTRDSRKPQSELHTCNRELVEFLIQHGYSAKSFNSACSIISNVPENLLHYWFRGLVDGDGCFYMSPDKKCRQFCVTSSYEQDWKYMEDIFKKLNVRYKIKHQISKSGDKSSQIRITSPFDIKSFGEWIYQNYEKDKIGLPRKYEKWKLISESCKTKRLKTKCL